MRIARALVVPALLAGTLPAFGHEGHGGREIGPYDLDAPRRVSPETAAHIGLKTAEVDFGVLEEVLELSGIVRPAPDGSWSISTRTAGKVLNVHVQVGDRVSRGDLLIELDSPELARNRYEARKIEADYQKLLLDVSRAAGRVRQLTVEAENAESTATLAEAELQRSEAAGASIALNVLTEKRTAAIRARGEARLKVVELEVTREEAAALQRQADALRLTRDALLALSNIGPDQLESTTQPAESDFASVRLTAPADGVVIRRNAVAGQWATAGDTLLAVADYSAVQIEGELPESLIARVSTRGSDAVRIRTPAAPQAVLTGRVKFISPVLDEVKRTAHVLIEAANPEGVLRDGTLVDLAIVLREEKTAVVVPKSAVAQDGPVHFVFVQNGDVYQKQDVNPGLQNDQVIEIVTGVVPGDVVVSQGVYSLTQLRPKVTAQVTPVAQKPVSR